MNGDKGRLGPELPSEQEVDEVLNRSAEERYETPRKYEDGDSGEDTDPVLPSNDATLNTKI